MKKLLLSAMLLAGTFCANAEEVVLFEDNFDGILPWCTDAVIDNFAANDEARSTPRWDTQYILDEEKGNDNGEYYLRNFLWGENKGYWAEGITNEGVGAGELGSQCVYFGRTFLKFGKKNNQANFRFQPALGQPEDFIKEIGVPAKFTFNWGPWRAGKGAMDVVILAVEISNGGAYEEIDRFTHALPEGSPLTWFDASVDLTDFEITPTTRIRIQPVDEAWQASGQHRWCLDNLKVVYTKESGEDPKPVFGGVMFEDNFDGILPWCTDAVIDNFAANDEATSTPRWDTQYILDEEKGNDNGEYYLRNFLWGENKGYWAEGITNEGVSAGELGSQCVYFGRTFLKFGKKNNQANFRFQPALAMGEDFVKEIGVPAKFTFNWGPWRAGKGAMDVVILAVEISNGGAYEEIDRFTHNLPDGSPLTWFDASVDLADFEITPATRIRIQPVDEAWQASGQHRWCLDNLKVVYGDEAGIGVIEAENSNAPVEFYNLQGVRVANPENGLFIRRQGNKVSKVFIR